MNSKKEPDRFEKLKPYTVLLPSRYGWVCALRADNFQTPAIALYGEWAPDETGLLLDVIKPGDMVLDIGANIGNVSLAFAAAVGPGGSVVAFEPQRFCYLCLCANIMLNSLAHIIQPVRSAVGAETGTVIVPNLSPFDDNVNFGGMSLLDGYKDGEAIGVITIDSLNLQQCNLIKIDVEGMEADIILGARETIARFKPIIWAEQLDIRKGTRESLRKALAAIGYKGWRMATFVYSANNARKQRENVFPNMADTNVYCIPENAPAPAWTQNFEKFWPV